MGRNQPMKQSPPRRPGVPSQVARRLLVQRDVHQALIEPMDVNNNGDPVPSVTSASNEHQDDPEELLQSMIRILDKLKAGYLTSELTVSFSEDEAEYFRLQRQFGRICLRRQSLQLVLYLVREMYFGKRRISNFCGRAFKVYLRFKYLVQQEKGVSEARNFYASKASLHNTFQPEFDQMIIEGVLSKVTSKNISLVAFKQYYLDFGVFIDESSTKLILAICAARGDDVAERLIQKFCKIDKDFKISLQDVIQGRETWVFDSVVRQVIYHLSASYREDPDKARISADGLFERLRSWGEIDDVYQIFSAYGQVIVWRLMDNLSSAKNIVSLFFKKIASYFPDSKDSDIVPSRAGELPSDDLIAAYANKHLHGYLATFLIRNNRVRPREMLESLSSFSIVISIIASQQVSQFCPQILQALKRFDTRSRTKATTEQLLKCWKSLIGRLKSEEIQSHASEMLSCLFNIYEVHPQTTFPLYVHIMTHIKDSTKLKKVHFLLPRRCLASSDLPDLSWIQACDDVASFSHHLKLNIKEIFDHCSNDVYQRRCLMHIWDYLTCYRDYLQVLKREEPMIKDNKRSFGSDFMSQLFTRIKDVSDREAKSYLGRIVGFIDYIKPELDCGEIEQLSNEDLPESIQIFRTAKTVKSSTFIRYFRKLDALRNKLIDSTKTTHGIQELLKVYAKASEKDVKTVFEKLPADLQPKFRPCLTSQMEDNWETPTESPVYSTDIQAKHWVKSWCKYLISFTSEPERDFFTALLPVVEVDNSFADDLIYQIVIYLFGHYCVAVDRVVCEIDAVASITQSESEEYMKILSSTAKPNATPEDVIYTIGDTYDEMAKEESCSGESEPEVQRIKAISEDRIECAQRIFSLIDKLYSWAANFPSKGTKDLPMALCQIFQSIRTFFEKLTGKQLFNLSLLAFHCRDYPRSIRFMEAFIRSAPSNITGIELEMHSPVLWQKLYLAVDEPDGVSGANKFQKNHSTVAEIVQHEANRHYEKALVSANRAYQSDPNSIEAIKTYASCLLNVKQEMAAIMLAGNTMSSFPSCRDEILPVYIEAATKLNRWDDLKDVITSNKVNLGSNFITNAAKIASFVYCRNSTEDTKPYLDLAYQYEIDCIKQLNIQKWNQASFIQAYPYLLNLVSLNQLEAISNILCNDDLIIDFEKHICSFMESFFLREESYVHSASTYDNYFTVFNSIVNLIKQSNEYKSNQTVIRHVNAYYTKFLLKWCKLARKNGSSGHNDAKFAHLESLFSSTCPEGCQMNEQESQLYADYICEKAKTLVAVGQPRDAFSYLEDSKIKYFKENNSNARCKLALLIGKISEKDGCLCVNKTIEHYTEARSHNIKADFHLAKCYDSLFKNTCCSKDYAEKQQGIKWAAKAAEHYTLAALHEDKNALESLSRYITIWMYTSDEKMEFDIQNQAKGEKQNIQQPSALREYGMRLDWVTKSFQKELFESLRKVNHRSLMGCLSQLIAQITNRNAHTQDKVFKIITSLLCSYPDQVLWYLMCSANTKCEDQIGRKAFKNISSQYINSNQSGKSARHLKVQSYFNFANMLIKMPKRDPKMIDYKASIENYLRGTNMANIIKQAQNQILIPLQSTMLSGPSLGNSKLPCIENVLPNVEIMNSLQQPVKIQFRCSDGRTYTMLYKLEDDLRKDKRAIEFINVVNHYLRSDVSAMERDLHTRTYMTTPLNEKCGLIEWVPNLVTLREAADHNYRHNSKDTGKGLVQLRNQAEAKSTNEAKIQTYRHVCAQYPPVLYEWFLYRFALPSNWFRAKLNFARSLAVTSMLGYVIGLGDRHTENILLDTQTGSLVHVDYNLLFNKGELSKIPELVPFRLTPNLVDGLGPTGVEGTFRKCCEVAMRVMRNKKDPLMSVVQPFISEPCADWMKSRDGLMIQDGSTAKTAKDSVSNIDYRLGGIPQVLFLVEHPAASKEQNAMRIGAVAQRFAPLSVEGQVKYLIDQAMTDSNLGLMFCGWMPFI